MPKRWVKIYDEDSNLISTYNSFKECAENENIDPNTITSHIKNGTPFIRRIGERIKIYFEAEPPHEQFTIAICENCGKEFQCQKWRIETRKHIFCCKKCEGEYIKNHLKKNAVCPVCGKLFHVQNKQKILYNNNYCSKECHYIAKMEYMKGEKNHQFGLKGDKNASWLSDERISYYGYKLIRMLDHPFSNCDGFVFEHRLIAEQYLLNEENTIVIDGKRYLSPDYIVHHINFDRQDNRVENLMIMLRSEHTSMHKKINNDEDLLAEYCIQYDLDFEKVKYNKNRFPKYNKNEKVS